MNMKRYEITNAIGIGNKFLRHSGLGDYAIEGPEKMSVSDGYHTMDELYEHRITLWIALCRQIENAGAYRIVVLKKEGETIKGGSRVWRSKKHSDGEPAFGGTWFLLGIGKDKGEQITYHLPIGRWDECDFAETLERAPEFDGHTSSDVLERIKLL